MSELGRAASVYATRGWLVFPLHGVVNGACTCGRRNCSSPGKHPLVRRGVHQATVEPAAISGWWRRWRRANVGIATGAESGITVVDIDLPAALKSLDRLIERLPRTLTALTGGGGVHLVYACDRRIGNAAGRLPGVAGELPGIDLRGDGGYIVAPPSAHVSGARYEWLDVGHVLAPLPERLVEERKTRATVCAPAPAQFVGDGSAYGLHVLREEMARVGRATEGRRNHELNRAAFAVARVVAGGELLEAPARAGLLAEARRVGLTEHESRLTIESAFAAGSRRPRTAPHRLRS